MCGKPYIHVYFLLLCCALRRFLRRLVHNISPPLFITLAGKCACLGCLRIRTEFTFLQLFCVDGWGISCKSVFSDRTSIKLILLCSCTSYCRCPTLFFSSSPLLLSTAVVMAWLRSLLQILQFLVPVLLIADADRTHTTRECADSAECYFPPYIFPLLIVSCPKQINCHLIPFTLRVFSSLTCIYIMLIIMIPLYVHRLLQPGIYQHYQVPGMY